MGAELLGEQRALDTGEGGVDDADADDEHRDDQAGTASLVSRYIGNANSDRRDTAGDVQRLPSDAVAEACRPRR